MSERRGFVCGGCWTTDRIKLIDRWPEQESIGRILALDRQGGGSAYNLGIDIRKLDATMPVTGIGLLGQDEDGDFLVAEAERHGIDTRQLHRSTATSSSYTDVMTVRDTGKRTFFHYPGLNAKLTPDHFDFSSTNARILHLGLPGLHEILDDPWESYPNGWVAVLDKAIRAGLQTNIELVSIDAERNRAICLPCLPYLDTLIVNDWEIGTLANMQTVHQGVTRAEDCIAAAQSLLTQERLKLIVVHYPAGAVAVTASGDIEVSNSVKLDPSTIAGSVGAGDAFAAGMLYAWHEHWPLANALELSHAAAAASLRSLNTVDSVESVDRCLALAGYQRPRSLDE